MCQEVKKTCSCGKRDAAFHLRDNVMSAQVIDRLFCPECSSDLKFNVDNMINDNGWVIEYDMDIARMYAIAKLTMNPGHVDPAFIFDEGYATWRETYPGETEDISEERSGIITMKDADQQAYLVAISEWAVNRVKQLKADGWRKALCA